MGRGGLHSLDLGGRKVPVRVRRNRRARRIVLRIDDDIDGAVVTVPAGTAIGEGLEMARAKAGWILGRLEALPPRVAFDDGAMVPLLGTLRRLRHCPGDRSPVCLEDGEIRVSGRREHLARRFTDWLRGEARRHIVPLAADKASRLGRGAGRIGVRDTRWRWGSCSAAGNLSFCWRLVMAPEWVLDYVVAHEVAHLAHRGHGRAFWCTVDGLTGDVEGARAWLRRHGPALHRYG